MHLKYILILFMPLLLLTNSTAQKAYFGFDIGYGTYEMTKNKEIIESYMRSNELQPQCVSNFPGYLFYRPYIGIEAQRLNVGIAYTLMSSGSRYSLHDYSGEYRFDAKNIGHAFSAFAETPIYLLKGLRFLIAAEGGIVYNRMNLNETFQLGDTYNQQDDYDFESFNVFIKPYLKVEYGISKRLNANVSVGYHKDLKANNMHLTEDDMSDSDFVSDWDGIRTSIGISYRLD